MICDKNSQEKFVGFIYSAKYDRENGHLDISIYIDYEYRKGLMAAEVGILFCDYLFKNYPIRKIYLSSYSDNITSLEFSKSAGFSEEGRLIKHKYFNGKYHDLITLGLFRENFYQILENIIKKL
jgi:RimJ/RimL family protein N-acetyltransferase